MKLRIISAAAAAAMALGVANAASVNTLVIASDAVGFVTDMSGSVATGSAWVYASSTFLESTSLVGIFENPNPRSFFEGLLAADPGLARSDIPVTAGGILSPGPAEVGAAGNYTYLFIDGGDAGLGVYRGQQVPGVGAITLNPTTILDPGDLVGTSVVQSINGTNSGFQLVPEPSVALLGALGALGLLRRRR